MRNLIDRGDYEISSDLGDNSGTEMVLKEEWPQDVEPGSNINMTALLHRVHPGDGSAPGNHTCPACFTVNTEGKANAGKSMINWYALVRINQLISDSSKYLISAPVERDSLF